MASTLPNVYCTRTLPQVAYDILKDKVRLEIWEGEDHSSREELLKQVKGRDGLITLLTDKVDKELLDAAGPQLKVITQFAVGFNNIDVKECSARGVVVTNTPGVLTETTAETALSLMLAAGRRIAEADRYVKDGKWVVGWHPLMLLGQDVHGSTVGIIGCGRIGQHLAKIVQTMGAKVIYYDVVQIPGLDALGIEYKEIEELCRLSDFISIHANLTPETTHLINDKLLSLMKPTCVVVNTARGPIIDENALYNALKDRKIGAAGLDVFENEPISNAHPLASLPNVVLLPHLGSASRATRDAMATLTAQNQVAFWEEKDLPSQVNTDVEPPSKKRRVV